MNRTLRAAALAVAALVPSAALAQSDNTVAAARGDILIKSPVAVPKQNGILATFMEIHNSGQTDVLTGVSSKGADRAVLANVVVKDGSRSAQQIPSIAITGGTMKPLTQETQHIVLMGVRNSNPGDVVPITLSFQNAGDIEMEVSVAAIQ